MRILVAEDDTHILAHLKAALEGEGHVIDCLSSGPEIYECGLDGDHHAIILDLGLPGMDGLSILRRWRKEGVGTPVLVVSARGSWMERVDGFDAGADDYLPKPFRTEELLARLKALLRRANPVAVQAVRAGGRFTLDRAARRILFDGRLLDLSPLEYRLLALLIEKRGTVLSPYEIARDVQGRDDDAAKNAVEAMIARLRKKTDMQAIETRRGFGYVLPDEPPA